MGGFVVDFDFRRQAVHVQGVGGDRHSRGARLGGQIDSVEGEVGRIGNAPPVAEILVGVHRVETERGFDAGVAVVVIIDEGDIAGRCGHQGRLTFVVVVERQVVGAYGENVASDPFDLGVVGGRGGDAGNRDGEVS